MEKTACGMLCLLPELGENWSRVNASEHRQMRYQIGGQECDNQGIGEGKLHQNGIISLARSEDLLIPDLLFQSWGFKVMRSMQWNNSTIRLPVFSVLGGERGCCSRKHSRGISRIFRNVLWQHSKPRRVKKAEWVKEWHFAAVTRPRVKVQCAEKLLRCWIPDLMAFSCRKKLHAKKYFYCFLTIRNLNETKDAVTVASFLTFSVHYHLII